MCKFCNLPTFGPSYGGDDVCSFCDCGYHRDGRRFTFRDLMRMNKSNEDQPEEIWQGNSFNAGNKRIATESSV